MASNTLFTIAGVHIEIGLDGTESVKRYPCGTYRDDGKYHPVVQYGRKNSQSLVAANVLIFADLPHAMTREQAWRWMQSDHPKAARFSRYRELIAANPVSSTDRGDVEQLRAEIAALRAERDELRATVAATASTDVAADVAAEVARLTGEVADEEATTETAGEVADEEATTETGEELVAAE